LIDAGDYRELVAPLLPGTSEVTGRRYAVLALARLGGASSWANAGERLGIPAPTAEAAADRPGRRVRDPERFWSAIAAVAARAAQRPQIDYAGRRRALSHLTEVPAEDLRVILAPLGLTVTAMRCRHAAAWVWADLTGGDVRDAPPYCLPWAASTSSRWASIARFSTLIAPRIEAPLRAWGMRLLDRAESE
jgi:hypothetical protein